MLSMLRHPLIPTFYSVFREGDRSYIAQEYVPGENLDEVVNRQGPIDPIAAATWPSRCAACSNTFMACRARRFP